MINKLVKAARYFIYHGDVPRLVVTAMAVVHGFIAVVFGTGLFISVGLQSSLSYKYLAGLPGWPLSVGALYVTLGIVILIARLRRDELSLVSSSAFLALAITSGMYGGFFLAGTIESRGIYGPQSMYLGFCTLYTLHSIYSFVEWLRDTRGVHNVPVDLVPANTNVD